MKPSQRGWLLAASNFTFLSFLQGGAKGRNLSEIAAWPKPGHHDKALSFEPRNGRLILRSLPFLETGGFV